MTINENQSAKKLTLAFVLINLFSFVIFYITYFVVSSSAMYYVYYYFTEITAALMPLIAAVATYVTFTKSGLGKSFLICLILTLSWILNLFPYYAFEYAYQGLLIGEVILFATLYTLLGIATIFVESILLFLIILFVTNKIAKNRNGGSDKGIITTKNDPLDFSSPVTAGIFSASCTMFIYNIICEIIDTVSFIRDVDGIYEAGEIFYIVFRYVFILIVLLASHFVSVIIKNKLTND